MGSNPRLSPLDLYATSLDLVVTGSHRAVKSAVAVSPYSRATAIAAGYPSATRPTVRSHLWPQRGRQAMGMNARVGFVRNAASLGSGRATSVRVVWGFWAGSRLPRGLARVPLTFRGWRADTWGDAPPVGSGGVQSKETRRRISPSAPRRAPLQLRGTSRSAARWDPRRPVSGRGSPGRPGHPMLRADRR